MQDAFKLVVNDTSEIEDFYKQGLEIYRAFAEDAKQTLTECIYDDIVNVAKLNSEWFPNVEADVFLSHSHKNLELAIMIAGYIYNKCGARCFIDSCVWGSIGTILNCFDSENCRSERNPKYYSYAKRNNSTAHMHMILSVALAKMIDKTKYFVLLNTPETIYATNINSGTYTNSPWIYHEINTANMLLSYNRAQRKDGVCTEGVAFQYSVNNNFKSVDIGKLINILREKFPKVLLGGYGYGE